MAAYVLIVDDDPAECRHIEEIVRSQGHLAESVASGGAALERLARRDAPPVSAVILDLVMPDLDGMAVMEQLARASIAVPVIVQATPGGADAGVTAMRAGAFDFLVKPASPERVRASLVNALRLGALEGEVLRMRLGQSGTLGLRDIVMQAPSMERVHRLAERAARSPIAVLIEGERGVGKELIARAIHGSGPRRSRPFVTVNCGEIDETEIDAILSGARKGATPNRSALQPNGGTLFLDEIGALSPASQETLARRLAAQEARGTPHGHPSSGSARLIAATSRRLIDLVREEGFLEELFYRLNVMPIWVPPLRERRADIPHLARSLLARLAAEAGRPSVRAISTAAMALLTADPWPGNISEMERAIFRAAMLCEGSELTSREFPSLTARSSGARAEPASIGANSSGLTEPAAGVAVQEQEVGEAPTLCGHIADSRPLARYGVARLLDDRGEMRPFEVLEEEVIRFAVEHYGGRMSEVARRLGIGRSTLYRKMRVYGIAAGEPVAS